jgi:hypothetical protein
MGLATGSCLLRDRLGKALLAAGQPYPTKWIGVEFLPPSCIHIAPQKGLIMKKFFAVAVVTGLLSLAACNTSPREQAADKIESNTEAVADNLEDAADATGNEAAEASLENKADAVRATGQNQAEDMRTNDPDTNLSNGI